MQAFLTGKFLTSRMFISVCLLIFAIYLFSLAAQKKQMEIHGDDIAKLTELIAEVSLENPVMKSLDKKIGLIPGESDPAQLASSRFKRLDYLFSTDWQMFSWIKTKTWLDIQQVNLPKNDILSPFQLKHIENYLVKYSSDNQINSSPIDVVRFGFYSDLIYNPEKRLETILRYQEKLGVLYSYFPKEAKVMAKNIFVLSQEMIAQGYLKKDDRILSQEEVRNLDILDFLLKIEPLIGLGEKKDYDWYYKSPLFCRYLKENEKVFSWLSIIDDDLGFSIEGDFESRYQGIKKQSKNCNNPMEDLDFPVWKAEALSLAKLEPPAGAWDLGKKFEIRNHFLGLLRQRIHGNLNR